MNRSFHSIPALGVIFLVACASTKSKTAERPVEKASFKGSGESKLHAKFRQDLRAGIDASTELLVLVDVFGAPSIDAFRQIGVHYTRPVKVNRRDATGVGVESAEDSYQSTSYLVSTPAELLSFIAVLPWVSTISPVTSWDMSLGIDRNVETKIDPDLRSKLRQFGSNRPIAVTGLAAMQGCLTPISSGQLASIGVIVGSSTDSPNCAETIFTFDAPLDSLTALASLPWIIEVEGPHQMSVQ
jgi:hypothetical protein